MWPLVHFGRNKTFLSISFLILLFVIFSSPCTAAPMSNQPIPEATSLFGENHQNYTLQLAESSFWRGDWKQAERYALQTGQNFRAEELLAAIAALGGDKAKAKEILTSIKNNTSDGMADFINGVLAAQDNSLQQAINDLQTAINKSNSHPVFLYYLGNIYLNQEKRDQAEDLFKKALNASPFLAEAQIGMGQIAVQNQDMISAAEWFQKATTNAPEVMEYHLQLINIYQQTNDKKKYDHAIKQMLYHTPGVKEALLKKGMLLLTTGSYAEAIEEMDKALNIYKNIPKAYYIKAAALANMDKVKATKDNLNSFLLAAWGNPLTHHYAGMCYLAIDDLKNAKKNFQKVISINPNFGKSFIPLTIIEQKEGNLTRALSGLNLALKNKEPSELVYYFIAHIKLAQNDLASYDQEMLKAAKLIPGIKEENAAIKPAKTSRKEFSLNRNLLALYFYNGWYGKALTISEYLLKDNQNDSFALYFNALARRAQDKKEAAQNMIERLKILNPDLQVYTEKT